MKGIDCASPISARAAQILKSEGYAFAGRYLVPGGFSKALTEAEARVICAAGLKILCVWETTAERMRGGAGAGAEDGAKAYAQARLLDIPEDAILYFAADFDAQMGEMDTLREYLAAARSQTGPYAVGIYGSYRVVEAMRTSCAKGFWQCVGWSGGNVSPAMSVYQAKWSGDPECKALAAKLGFDVDIDICPNAERAGLWTYQEADETPAPRYNTVAELPDWAQPTIQKLIAKGCIQGGGTSYDEEGNPADMDLSHDMVRLLVMHDRAGAYDT